MPAEDMIGILAVLAVLEETGLTLRIIPSEEEARRLFAGDDLAQLIMNSIARDRWEEGTSIRFDRGVLLVRNTPEVVQACGQFIADLRRTRSRPLMVRADTLLISAETADTILGRVGTDSYVLEAKQYDRLIRAGTILEQVGWHSYETQRTAMGWSRSLGYLMDFEEPEDPVPGHFRVTSCLDLRALLAQDQRSIALELRFFDRRFDGFKTLGVWKDRTIEMPHATHVKTKASLRIPQGTWAAFKWSTPPKEGAERRYLLLLLKPVLWRE